MELKQKSFAVILLVIVQTCFGVVTAVAENQTKMSPSKIDDDVKSTPNSNTKFIMSKKLTVPSDLIVWFRNETTFVLLWRVNPTEQITHYRVTIDPQDATHNTLFVKKRVIDSPEQATFTGLVPGRAYTISVQSVNDNEISQPKNRTYRTMPLKPFNLTVEEESITTNSFRLSWNAPTSPVDFDAYQVKISKLGGYNISRTDDPVMRFEVKENLRSGETYNIFVKAISGMVTSWPAFATVTLKKP